VAPRRVVVTNFPDPQSVTGAVKVTNLPAVQDVNVLSAPPAGGTRFQLVGFTSLLLPGGQGVLALTHACQLEFAKSRMCTSLEVLETTRVPSGLVGEAWVRPSPVTSDSAGNWSDASGARVAQGEDLTCSGWSMATPGTGRAGLTVDASGRFAPSNFVGTGAFCDTPRPIACCAAVP
jgi:hypothetical protein